MSSPLKKIVSFKAKLISGSITYSGIIESLSKNSLYVRTVSKKPASDFTPGETLKVNFQPDAGEKISLFCRVKWSYKTPPHGITDSLGIEIIPPLSNYERLFNTM